MGSQQVALLVPTLMKWSAYRSISSTQLRASRGQTWRPSLAVSTGLTRKKRYIFNFGTLFIILLWIETKNNGNVLILSCIWPILLQISSKICRFYAFHKILLQSYSSQPNYSFLFSAVCLKKKVLFIFPSLASAVLHTIANYIHPVFLLSCWLLTEAECAVAICIVVEIWRWCRFNSSRSLCWSNSST